MPWFKVDKDSAVQPDGVYKQWKEIVRKECKCQCVYCSINEGSFGGVRNFHLDHYRPKKTFAHLENVISNIFYACSICNSFKGADWPNEPALDFSNYSYPDPSKVDYSTILNEDDGGVVYSHVVSGRYLVERLYINRPQMIMLRRRDNIVDEINRLANTLTEAFCDGCFPLDRAADAVEIINRALRSVSKIKDLVPYEIEDAARSR
ncbi:HNH endonuclease [Xanthomonas euvesicatoria pv. allii]|uniref:HNH endonuclease n=1 Tax=Xanthomonas euvesicatoria TaxID=456327 RepID=UPI0024073ED0|nr:HNH endonuclease [Xanthomonas euvesicatoria pv. allii]MCP3053175.1 HNH endonuclease [Xanthomonas euvesicatoria pv. allii]